MRLVLKVDRLGGKAEIRALAAGDEHIHRFEVTARDYVSFNALPVRIPFTPAREDGQQQTEDRTPEGGLYAKLRDVFISEARMKDLADLMKLNIIQKLIPSLQKEGYEEARTEARTEDDRQAEEDARDKARRGGPSERRLSIEPESDMVPPDFEDPHEILRPAWRANVQPPVRSPFNIGHDDLNPPGLGPHDPLRGSFVPGGGLPRPAGDHGGGMHPTFDDPLFNPDGESGSGFDPQRPPGARWDPTGPEIPGFGRRGGGSDRFGRGSGGYDWHRGGII